MNEKSVTPAVLAANRANSKRSTGPRRTGTVKHNAIKHGLLMRDLHFKDEQGEAEFKKFRHELMADIRPEGAIETMLVEEVAVCWWKLREAMDWESKLFKASRSAAKATVEAYGESSQSCSFDWSDDFSEDRTIQPRVSGDDPACRREQQEYRFIHRARRTKRAPIRG